MISDDVTSALGQLPEKKNEADLVIINHRLNPSAIGDILTAARRSSKNVFVLMNRRNRRIDSIARSYGVSSIDPSDDAQLDALNELILKYSEGVLVTLHGNGAHNPGQIHELVKQIRSGYDIVVDVSSTGHRYEDDNVYLLNNRPIPGTSGFIACKCKCLGPIKANGTPVNIADLILDRAKDHNLSIKYLDTYDPRDLLSQYSIGIVVPAYNEELLIEETVRGIPEYVERIYVIDDCSTDQTSNIVRQLNDPRVTFVRHEKNKGVGAAVITGYKLAVKDGMDIVAVMAGDNQMDPAQLPRLLLPVIEGKADYAKGNRLVNKKSSAGMSTWRRFGNNLLSLLTKVASGYWHISDPQNGYTAISGQALMALDLDSIYTYYGYCNDLLIKLNTFGMRAIDVTIPARYGRERSSIRYGKFILKVAPMIFRGFLWRLKTKYVVLDSNPLILFYVAGMLLVPLGLIACAGILAEIELNASVSSAYPLLAAFTVIMGLQFLFFGMMFDMQAGRNDGKTVPAGGDKVERTP